jgi:GT2 family glycosyltransferase
MFMDADDILTQNAINILREQISDNDMVIGLRQDFISPDCVNKSVDIKTSGHTVIAGCALMKKSAFDNIGLFDEDLMCGDSYDWILRAQKAGLAIKRIDNILCLRRIHDTNMGRMLKEQEYADYCKIIRKHFVKK